MCKFIRFKFILLVTSNLNYIELQLIDSQYFLHNTDINYVKPSHSELSHLLS